MATAQELQFALDLAGVSANRSGPYTTIPQPLRSAMWDTIQTSTGNAAGFIGTDRNTFLNRGMIHNNSLRTVRETMVPQGTPAQLSQQLTQALQNNPPTPPTAQIPAPIGPQPTPAPIGPAPTPAPQPQPAPIAPTPAPTPTPTPAPTPAPTPTPQPQPDPSFNQNPQLPSGQGTIPPLQPDSLTNTPQNLFELPARGEIGQDQAQNIGASLSAELARQAIGLAGPEGFNPQIFPGDLRVAPMSQQQLQGMDMLLQGSTVGQSTADQAVQQSLNATGGPGGDAMTAAMFQAATAGQSPAAVQQAIQQALQANMGQGNIFAEIMRGGAADPTTALQQSLSGQINLDAIQPQLESAAQRFNQELNMNIMPQIQSQAVSYGGLGGSRDAMARGIAGGLAGQELARVQGDLVSQEMQRALTRQHEAGMGMTDLGVRSGLDLGNLQLQGAQIGGNLGLGQGQLGIAGAETLGQIGADFGRLGLQGATTALSGAPIQQQLALTPGQTMMGIGEQMQQQDQAQRLALQAAFDEQQWAPIDRLTALQPFGTYGFQQQQVRNPSSGQQAILGALGGASAGAGIYSALGATGAFAPWLAIPAALGGVAGLFD